MRVLLIIAVVLISACGSKTIPVSIPLPCPNVLQLPVATGDLLLKIDNMDMELYTFFFRRDALQSKRRATLQAICRTTYK